MYLNLYLFAACFLPLITFRPARNNFQVGTNLATAQTLVDQPFNDEDQLFARDVSNYTNFYLERRQFDISSDRSIVGIIENSENSKQCIATKVDNRNHALTAAHCVHSGEAPLPGIKFTAGDDNIKLTVDEVIIFGDWRERRLPHYDIAVIHIDNSYEPSSWMNINTWQGVLSRESKVDTLGVTVDLSTMHMLRATITQIGRGLPVFELLTNVATEGAPVFLQGDDRAPTIYGVISKWEDDDDDEGNMLHFSVAGITPKILGEIQSYLNENI